MPRFILKPTVIGEEKLENDYLAYDDGKQFGRIYIERSPPYRWFWFLQDHLACVSMVQNTGSADSLDAARGDLKRVWLKWLGSKPQT